MSELLHCHYHSSVLSTGCWFTEWRDLCSRSISWSIILLAWVSDVRYWIISALVVPVYLSHRVWHEDFNNRITISPYFNRGEGTRNDESHTEYFTDYGTYWESPLLAYFIWWQQFIFHGKTLLWAGVPWGAKSIESWQHEGWIHLSKKNRKRKQIAVNFSSKTIEHCKMIVSVLVIRSFSCSNRIITSRISLSHT